MRVLVIGGSGHVGTIALPHLAARHELRIFDLKPPRADVDADYVQGDLRDFAAVRGAVEGCDSLVFMAMGPMADWGTPENAWRHFEVASGGLHAALRAARDGGITHAVYISSMSVYEEQVPRTRSYPDENHEPNATDFYGLAKRFGEQVCQAACTSAGMSVVALRLCFPTPDEAWPNSDPYRTALATSARDTAEAISLALGYRGRGFEAIGISGHAAGRLIDVSKARSLLAWEPLDPAPEAPHSAS